MKLTRTVKQEANCGCPYKCEDGSVTPYPLDFSDGNNDLGDYCKHCGHLDWINVKVLS